jgi:hypothetical protein
VIWTCFAYYLNPLLLFASLTLPTFDKYAKQLARLLLFSGRILSHLHDEAWESTRATFEELAGAIETARERERENGNPSFTPTAQNIDPDVAHRAVLAVNFQLIRLSNVLDDMHTHNATGLNRPRSFVDAFVRGSALEVGSNDSRFVANSPTYVRKASAALQFCLRLSFVGTMVHAAELDDPDLQRWFDHPSRLTNSPVMLSLTQISAVCRRVETILNPNTGST